MHQLHGFCVNIFMIMLDETAISCLSDKTSLGPDGLPAIKKNINTLAEPLCLLVNQSLSEQTMTNI